MSKLNELIKKFCPTGVEYKKLWELTAWDRKFKGVDKAKQKKIVPYKYILVSEFEKIKQINGNVKYIATGVSGKEYYTTEELAGDYLFEGEVICIPGGGTPNVKYYNGKFITGSNCIATSLDKSVLNNKFLYYYLESKIKNIAKFYRGSGIKHPDMSKILELKIPLPPLPVQEEIVKILDKFTDLENELENELRMRKMQFNAYRDKLLTFDNGVRFEKLGNLCEIKTGIGITKKDMCEDGRYKIISGGKTPMGSCDYFNRFANTVTIARAGSAGYINFIYDDFYLNDKCFSVIPKSKVIMSRFLYFYLKANQYYIYSLKSSGTVPTININKISKITIPVPPLEKQKEIVEKLDKFNGMCNEINDGLPLEIELRKKQYEFYRDKLLSFDKKAS